jgi:hypothetical protein
MEFSMNTNTAKVDAALRNLDAALLPELAELYTPHAAALYRASGLVR